MQTRYSHPPEDERDGVRLKDHLDDVAERVRYVVPSGATTPAGEPLRDVVETLAHVHDLGKATTYFQQYLGVLPGEPKRDIFRYHAPLGAFAAYYALDSRGFDAETCLAGFVAVGKHHGQIPDVAEYVFDRTHRREGVSRENANEKLQSAIASQITDIGDEVPELAEMVFRDATDEAGSWDSFREGFRGLLGEIEAVVGTSGNAPGVNRNALSESCYALVLECWGTLVLADKTSAAEASRGKTAAAEAYEAEVPDAADLDEYVEGLEASASTDRDGSRSERLNYHRSRARQAVKENAERFAERGGGVATITLPTGMGKTLSGLSAAFAIRDRLDGERIVYALPFTSIIDQVVDELEDVFRTDTAGRLITAHHHLAETVVRSEEEGAADRADQTDDVAGMLGESWRAGVTVTTFVQLFESLAGPGNQQSMKLPALRNSVVVLDEPQSLPIDWWKLVPRLVTVLTERFGASVIAMTATQPQLFHEATELVDDPDTYFESASRVRYELDPSTERYIADREEPKSYEDAEAELLGSIASGESALAICNTIDSARELTDRVQASDRALVDVAGVYAETLETSGSADEIDVPDVAEQIVRQGNAATIHLSTRLRPMDRLWLIEIAKELTERAHPLLTISTQLVEAGVDISFDRVYRDLAPIDSIVQAAGRCNRSFERDQGRVTVWWLEAPGAQQKTPGEAVYNRGPALLPVAAETLESVRDEYDQLSETAVARTAVDQYYRRLHEEKNVGRSEYASYVDEARGDDLASLSLIDERLAIDVVVCRTADERDAARSVRDAWDRFDFDAVDALMGDLRSKQISVPIYRPDSDEADVLRDLPPIHAGTDVRYIDPGATQFVDYFDPTTGFVVPDSTVERRFL